MGDERIAAWISDLSSDDFEKRYDAVCGLADHGDVSALPALIQLGLDPDEEEDVQYYGWEAVRNIAGVDGFVDTFVPHLRDADPRIRVTAATALAEWGSSRARDALVEALSDSAPSVRATSLAALRVHGDASSVPAVTACLQDTDADVRSAAARALAALVPEEAPILDQLGDPDWEVRRDACMSLAEEPDVRALDQLVVLLGDADQPVPLRFKAAEALGSLRDPRVVAPLVAALQDEVSSDLRHTAAIALGTAGFSEAVEPLTHYLAADRDESDCHAFAATALADIGDPSALPALLDAAHDPRPEVREAVARALGRLGGDGVFAALSALLRDDEDEVRTAATEALGDLGDARAVELLRGVLSTGSDDAREQAAYSLGQLEAADAVDDLLAALTSPSRFLRLNAATALGRVGDPRAFAALLALLDDEPGVAWQAALALGEVTGPERLPELRAHGESPSLALLGSMAKLGDRAAAEQLRVALKNDDLRFRAAFQLARIPDSSVVETCIEALGSRYYNIVLEAVVALEALSLPRSIEALLELAEHHKSGYRHAARLALRRLGVM